MTLYVHIILPSGTRYGEEWTERTTPPIRKIPTDAQVLQILDVNKRKFGFNKLIAPSGPMSFGDESSGYVYDHKDTIVAVVDEVGNEIRRLKGPKHEVAT